MWKFRGWCRMFFKRWSMKLIFVYFTITTSEVWSRYDSCPVWSPLQCHHTVWSPLQCHHTVWPLWKLLNFINAQFYWFCCTSQIQNFKDKINDPQLNIKTCFSALLPNRDTNPSKRLWSFLVCTHPENQAFNIQYMILTWLSLAFEDYI
jgi:hypothetical protein